MKIHILSDLHREIGSFTYPETDADVVVLAGDIDQGTAGIEWAKGIGKPVVYVAGNHEYYGLDYYETLRAMRKAAAGSNVHFLENGSAVINEVRFLGCTLWTDFGLAYSEGVSLIRHPEMPPHVALIWDALSRMNDYRKISATSWWQKASNQRAWRKLVDGDYLAIEERRRFNPLVALALHQASRAWIEKQLAMPFDGSTVVVTHHAPSYESLLKGNFAASYQLEASHWYPTRDGDNFRIAAYASDLDPLIWAHKSQIALWIHGHTHAPLQYGHCGVPVICNPRGYFDPPLTEKSAQVMAAFASIRLSDEDIRRDQDHFAQNPERGDVQGFDGHKVVELEGLMHRTVMPSVEERIAAMVLLVDDAKSHLHYLRYKDQGIVNLAGHHIAAQGEQFNAGVFELLMDVAKALGLEEPEQHEIPHLPDMLGLVPRNTTGKQRHISFSVPDRYWPPGTWSQDEPPSQWGRRAVREMVQVMRNLRTGLSRVLSNSGWRQGTS